MRGTAEGVEFARKNRATQKSGRACGTRTPFVGGAFIVALQQPTLR